MYTVFVRGIEFYGYHGVPVEERVVGHRYRVDVELRVNGVADNSDEVSQTVDYGELGLLVVQIGAEERVSTVERLARIIGESILAKFGLVESLWISVAKPLPPAPMIADSAGVELEISR